jgi:hypothetical protein
MVNPEKGCLVFSQNDGFVNISIKIHYTNLPETLHIDDIQQENTGR